MNIRIIIVILGLFLSSSCREAKVEIVKDRYVKLDAVSLDRWDALSRKKVFFGHKSVGANIIEGLKDVLSQRPQIRLDVRETDNPAGFTAPVFAHSAIGKNNEPLTKLARFREIMESGVGRESDIAFFKFCFVDVNHDTNLEALFSSYVELVEDLADRFPDLKILTVTVPLLSKPVGVMTRLKKLLGRLPWYEADNVQRNLFNDMLRDRFKGSLFDLAAIESRIDDSKKAVFRESQKEYELLYRPFTDDGGHLNLLGRQVVAIELLTLLAGIDDPAT